MAGRLTTFPKPSVADEVGIVGCTNTLPVCPSTTNRLGSVLDGAATTTAPSCRIAILGKSNGHPLPPPLAGVIVADHKTAPVTASESVIFMGLALSHGCVVISPPKTSLIEIHHCSVELNTRQVQSPKARLERSAMVKTRTQEVQTREWSPTEML